MKTNSDAHGPGAGLGPGLRPVALSTLVLLILAACVSRPAERPPAPAQPEVASPPQAPEPPAAPAATDNDDPEKQLPPLEGEGWTSLFDGRSLDGWVVTGFAGHGEVEVRNGQMILGMGAMLTGVNLVNTNDIPTLNYELVVDAMKVDGSDFFCALTFPVGESCCTFLLGGWGGGVVGISSINGNDASLNETTKYLDFERGRWYRVRVRVTKPKLECWVGAKKMVDLDLEGKRLSVRPGEIELNQPFGIATYQTTGAIRDVQWRRLR